MYRNKGLKCVNIPCSMVLFFWGEGDATQQLMESQRCWTSSIYCFRDCSSNLYVVPFKICFPFSWNCIKFFFPLSICLLYITTHLYKVFKFIYKMCIYIFFVSLLDFFFFFCRMKPRCRQMDINSCIKGSVALTNIALKAIL